MTAQHFAESGLGGEPAAVPQSLYRDFLDTLPDAALVLDAGTGVRYANPAALRLLGAGDWVGQRVDALLPQGADASWLASLAEGARLCDRDLELRRPDGVALRVSASSGPVPGGPGCVLYLRDLGDRVRREEELRRSNGELEHCIHTLSHDLRSPLVALLGFSRLLRQDYETRLDDTGRHFLDRIEQAGRTMEDLIHDLLELSRIEQSSSRRSWIDPRAVLIQLQAEFKPRLDAVGIVMRVPESPPLVLCDRTRLYQVFSNLIDNALEHMGACDEPYVEVDVRDGGSHHHVTVRDPGAGVPSEHHERIFQVFQSLGPRRDGQRGTGIGLAIVRKIAETHGGRAWVESEPGAGSVFHVTLAKS